MAAAMSLLSQVPACTHSFPLLSCFLPSLRSSYSSSFSVFLQVLCSCCFPHSSFLPSAQGLSQALFLPAFSLLFSVLFQVSFSFQHMLTHMIAISFSASFQVIPQPVLTVAGKVISFMLGRSACRHCFPFTPSGCCWHHCLSPSHRQLKAASVCHFLFSATVTPFLLPRFLSLFPLMPVTPQGQGKPALPPRAAVKPSFPFD